MPYEDIALTDQPDGSHDQRGPIGIGHETAHEIDGKPQEWSRFLAYEPTIHRSRTDGFPVEDVDIPGDVVARGQRPELLADEFPRARSLGIACVSCAWDSWCSVSARMASRNTSRYSPSLVLKW